MSLSFISFFFLLIEAVDLQCSVSVWYTYTKVIQLYIYIHILFHILSHDGLSQGIGYSFLCSVVGPFRLPISYIIVRIC